MNRLDLLSGVIYGTIQDCGAQGAISGVIYSVLMNVISIDEYQEIINKLETEGKIKNKGHLLVAV